MPWYVFSIAVLPMLIGAGMLGTGTERKLAIGMIVSSLYSAIVASILTYVYYCH